MNNKLITALRLAARAIEDGTFDYDWFDGAKCNCGALCSALLGKSQKQISNMLPNEMGTWSEFVGSECPITGIPSKKILRTLLSSGLTAVDLVQLEELSNPEVLSRLRDKRIIIRKRLFRKPVVSTVEERAKVGRENRTDVVRYMRAWADMLVERGREDEGRESQSLVTSATA
jgi:hypothetical protein